MRDDQAQRQTEEIGREEAKRALVLGKGNHFGLYIDVHDYSSFDYIPLDSINLIREILVPRRYVRP